MRRELGVLGTLGILMLATAPPVAAEFGGANAWHPGNGYDAPIFRQFAFVEGRVTMYHVLKPDLFPTDEHMSYIYQFPQCPDLLPVLQQHAPDHDAPTRQIVDVVLPSCEEQPLSAGEVDVLGITQVVREMYVNAPKIPARFADLADDELFNGPPFRPRAAAYEEGVLVKFITYETSWHPTWLGTNFPAEDADVFIISYGPLYQEGFTILNTAAGTPLDPATFMGYSPIWRANCIVDADDPVCNSVNLLDPAYFQCKSVAECLSMTNSAGHHVEVIKPAGFSHINCPMVAVDLTLDDYVSVTEELLFPDLWVNGPVIA